MLASRGSYYVGSDHFSSKPPYAFNDERRTSEAKLVAFMREIIIPLAAENNAVILCSADTHDSDLTKAFFSALSISQSRWIGHSPPFTVIGWVIKL